MQLNPVQIENSYELTLKACKLSDKENVLELYYSAGTIGIYLSKMAKEIIGIELNEKAVENASYYASCVYKVLTKLFKDNINIDVVVCDPPMWRLLSC